MINRKLAISNIIVILLCIFALVSIAYRSMEELLYRENKLIYQSSVSEVYDEWANTFNTSEKSILSLCADSTIHRILQSDSLPDSGELQKALSSFVSMNDETLSAAVYPIRNGTVYDYDEQIKEWIVLGDEDDYPNLNYRYKWEFTPQGKDVIRVSRDIYSLQDISQRIAVAHIDISLPPMVTALYSFGVSDNAGGEMVLVDQNNNYLLPYHRSGELNLEGYTVLEDMASIAYSMAGQTFAYETSFSNNGWKLITIFESSSLLNGFAEFRQRILALGILLAVLAIALSFLLTLKITRPLLTLSDQITSSAKTERYVALKTPKRTSKEIRTLYDAYNYLIQEVNNSIKHIQEFSKKESENQFLLLQAQINPHFLYNTLNAISFMAQNNQNDDIEQMVVSLVTMFRNSLNNGKPFISLKGEIEHVRAYLNIMNYRYPDHYNVVYNIEENCENLLVTKQILQPLAENALTHGFLESHRKGSIIIEANRQDGYLIIKMTNSGARIDLQLVDRILQGDPQVVSRHYGIRNVNSRLISYYGEECGLHYTIEQENTVVQIRLPLEKLKENNEYE